ncbi:MAG: HD domain-containing phosphohydrolase [Thermodesulfobacteriota bacterium]
MVHLPDLKWIVDCSYSGRILFGDYSLRLKRKLAEYIACFHAFDKLDNPAIPYISAWQNGGRNIWYEFAGRRFQAMFAGEDSDLAGNFGRRVVDRHFYTPPADSQEGIFRTTLSARELDSRRQELRSRGVADGHVNAVYKIAMDDGSPIWFKDQANVECFPEDGICLSRGILVDVTNEMEAEEELKRVQTELQQHRSHLEEKVQDRTRKLWKSQMEVVSRLARAAEFRDNRTGRHLTNISSYCGVIGKAAGLPRAAASILYLAAPMHDIGKIGISDHILQKTGKLSVDEFEEMKGHCDIGARLLSGHDSDLLRVARVIALNHHERWDGSGYPQGLQGRSIPMAGRITAICDVFDALTSERPYKKAWPVETAVEEIQRGRGSHFDPFLVDVFMKQLPAIREIHDQRPS